MFPFLWIAEVSPYELDSTKTGKLTAEALSDFQYARTECSLRHGLYIRHSNELLSHFFARMSADSLANIESSQDLTLLYSSMNTLGLWKLNSRQDNLMLTQFLSCLSKGSHEHYLSSFNDQAIRVLSAFESVDPQHKGYISFDVFKWSTYPTSVDQSFFLCILISLWKLQTAVSVPRRKYRTISRHTILSAVQRQSYLLLTA